LRCEGLPSRPVQAVERRSEGVNESDVPEQTAKTRLI